MRAAVFLLGVASVATGLYGARSSLTMPSEAEVCTFVRAAGVSGTCGGADGHTPEREAAGQAQDRAGRRAVPVRT